MNKRSRPRIRSWMVRKNITGVSVAKALGISNALVCATIAGYRNNRRVLTHLLTLGCPAKILRLPSDLQPTGATP